jgi:hypothetical protein
VDENTEQDGGKTPDDAVVPDSSEPTGGAEQPTPPPVTREEPPTVSLPSRKSEEARRAAMAQAIQNEVVQGGRIESQSDFQAVFVFGKPVNHILHLLLTVLTCGIWGLVWLGLIIWGGEERIMVQIDDYGNVLRQKIK